MRGDIGLLMDDGGRLAGDSALLMKDCGMLMGDSALLMKDGAILMEDNGLLMGDNAIMTGYRGLLKDVRCGEGVSSFWGDKMAVLMGGLKCERTGNFRCYYI